MNRAILSLAVALFSISPVIPAIAQTPRPINSTEFPAQGASVQSLVPKGWKVESTTQGDLNGDRRSDAVLRLIQTDTAKFEPGRARRVLLVLQKQSNGQWRRIGFAPRLLLCERCGAMLTSIQLKIENGVLLVDQLGGSRDAQQTLHRFWIDKASNRMVLIGLDVRNFDRLTGDATQESSNFLTGQKITEEYRGKRQQDELKQELVSSRRSTIPKTTPALETVVSDWLD
ncbi:hypothetical protein LEP3755_19630 [Leptolyngbya sp. NIES-3755]|nr:hypothetical protein LEP3755_19630 [Leptolyngbya sp. NIES-3755]